MPNTYSKGQYRTTGRNGETGQKEGIRLKEIKTKCIEGMQRKQEPKKKRDMVTGEDIKYTSAVWEAGWKGKRATNKWPRSEVHA